MMKVKHYIKGAALLGAAGILGKILSVFYKIPLTLIVKEEGLGYYQTVYPIYTLLIAAALVGIPNTVSKLVAESRGSGQLALPKQYLKVALILSVTISGLISMLMFLTTNYWIQLFGWHPGTKYVIYGFALSPMFVGYAGAMRGYFQGNEDMVPSAIAQLLENLFKVLVGISLVYILMSRLSSPQIAIMGASIGISVSFFIACVYLTFMYFRHSQRINNVASERLKFNQFKSLARKIVIAVIPITILSATYSIMNGIDSMTVYHLLDHLPIEQVVKEIGRLGKVFSIINVPLTLSFAISAVTVPVIAGLRTSGKENNLSTAVIGSLKVGVAIAIPSGIGIALLADELINFLFPGVGGGGIYLQYFGLCLIFMIISQVAISVCQGLGYLYKLLIGLLIASIVKVIVNILLVPTQLMLIGALIGDIIFYIIIAAFCLRVIQRRIKFGVVQMTLKPLISGLVMAIAVYFLRQITLGLLPLAVVVLLCVMLGALVYSGIIISTHYFGEDLLEVLPFMKKLSLRKKD